MLNQPQIDRMLEKLRRFENVLDELIYKKAGVLEISKYLTFDKLHQIPADENLYTPVKKDEKWGAEKQYAWFKGRYTVPDDLQGQTLFLKPQFGSFEALLWVNGTPFGNFAYRVCNTGHGNHYCKMIKQAAKAGENIDIAVEAYAGHNIEGTQPDERYTGHKFDYTIGEFEICVKNEDIYDFYYNLKTINQLWTSLEANSFRKGQLTNALTEVHKVVYYSYDKCEYDVFVDSVKKANEILKTELERKTHSSAGRAGLIGHSHMDTAWLWEIDETIKKCARTYSNQLNLMAQYDEYKFIQSSAYHLEVIRRNYPSLFDNLKKVIAKGKYEPNGGVWVECDCNITSGEFMIRQFLWGQRYTRKHFGYTSNTFWLPDTFGYSASIPQIMKGCSIDYFCTTKIEWNDTNEFPYDTFYWQGIDGTKVLSHFNKTHLNPSPNDIINLVAKRDCRNLMQKSVTDKRLLAFGAGDGGGGPENEHLEMARRCLDLDGCPKSEYQTVAKFMEETAQNIKNPNTWSGELYLELHRATLTALHQMKRNNRKAELSIRDAEILTVNDAVVNNKTATDENIKELVETVLVNQFHDILPGTSIPEVNDRAYRENADVIRQANETAKMKLQENTDNDKDYLTLYNTLSFARSDVITIFKNDGKGLDCELTQQLTRNINDENILRISGANIASFSSKSYKLIDFNAVKKHDSPFKYKNNQLTTPFAIIDFDSDGTIKSFTDIKENRQLQKGGYNLNTFIMCEDLPLRWDNWDIDADSELKYKNVSNLISSKIISNGAVEFRIRNKYQLSKNSTLKQDVIFYADSPKVDFETIIDWNDAHRFLKTSFDTVLHANTVRQEIQFGYAQRPTTRNDSFEQAKFETLNHKYTDLSESRYGVAILNDCKYGISANGGSLRLSLIKSGTHPDPRADKGVHHLTYSFLPHTGSFSAENVIRPAYELNVPCIAAKGKSETNSWLSLDKPNVIIETVKPCEDEQKAYILRLYEAEGGHANVKLKINHSVKSVELTNMLEEVQDKLPIENEVNLSFTPFEIKTVKIGY